MKYIIMLLLCFCLVGCEHKFSPNIHEAGVIVCESNGGYRTIETDGSFGYEVICIDGATFEIDHYGDNKWKVVTAKTNTELTNKLTSLLNNRFSGD